MKTHRLWDGLLSSYPEGSTLCQACSTYPHSKAGTKTIYEGLWKQGLSRRARLGTTLGVYPSQVLPVPTGADPSAPQQREEAGLWQGLLWTSCHFGRENKLTTLSLPFCPLKISRNYSVSKLLTCDNNRRVNSKTWLKLCLGCRTDKTNTNASI